MSFEVTDLRKANVPDAAQLWEDGWHDAHAAIVPEALRALRTSDTFRERLFDKIDMARVVLRDGQVLGLCMTQEDELYQMYVAPQARGLGLAQVLIADAELRIKAAGYTSAWLACAVGNDRAARFYEKTGWRNTGVAPVALDTSAGTFELDVWRFEKELAP